MGGASSSSPKHSGRKKENGLTRMDLGTGHHRTEERPGTKSTLDEKWRMKHTLTESRSRTLKAGKHKGLQLNPEFVPYHHDPPGHTCGLPCCSEDLQIQLRVRSRPKSCVAFPHPEDDDELHNNFTLSNRRQLPRGHPDAYESDNFQIQEEPREATRASAPKAGNNRSVGKHYLKGREITLPDDSKVTTVRGEGEAKNADEMELLYVGSGSEIDYYMTETVPDADRNCLSESLKGDMNPYIADESILDVDPLSEIDYYVGARAPNGDSSCSYNEAQDKQWYTSGLTLDLKRGVTESGPEEDSSNYYEVIE